MSRSGRCSVRPSFSAFIQTGGRIKKRQLPPVAPVASVTCSLQCRVTYLPVGFVAVALNPYYERMGAIDIIATDPDHHRRGIATALTTVALDHMRSSGMDVAVVETGGDPGHAPARATYVATGFTLLPIARYFQLVDQEPKG